MQITTLPKELVNIILEYEGSIRYRNGKYINAYRGNVTHMQNISKIAHVGTNIVRINLNEIYTLIYIIAAHSTHFHFVKRAHYRDHYLLGEGAYRIQSRTRI
jgi:hypothetical protein